MITDTKKSEQESQKPTESKQNSPQNIRHYVVIPGELNTISETFTTAKNSPELAVFSKLLEAKGLEEFRRRKGPQNKMQVFYCEKVGHVTIQSINDREIMKVYTQFEKGIVSLLNRGFNDGDLIQAKILLVKDLYQLVKPKLQSNLTDTQRLEKIDFILRCLEVTQQEMIQTVNANILEKIKAGQSSQIIYGKASENLEMYVSQGWVVERFAKGLSINKEQYSN